MWPFLVLSVVLGFVADGPATPHTGEESAPPIHVLVVKAPTGDYPAKGEVLARDEGGRAAEIRVPFVIPAGEPAVEVAIALPGYGRWWLGVDGRGLFSRPELLAFPLETRLVILEARPLVSLTARPVAREGAPVEGRTALVRWRATASEGPWESAETVVSEGKLDAEIPAGLWDLAVKVRGFGSFRRERVVATPGAPLDLGAISIVPGASLVGRVASRNRDESLRSEKIRITLSPVGEIPATGSQGDGIRLETEARPSARGDFQFSGIAAGRHNLRVFARGFAREDRVLDLAPDLEVELRDPILLARPAQLRVDMSPVLDPQGSPWVVEVRESGEAGWLPGAAVTRTSAGGTVTLDGLRRDAEYVAIVYTGSHDPWRVQTVTTAGPLTRISLRLDGVEIQGRLTLGGEPLRAKLSFGGKMAAPSIPAVSGEDGEFRAHLPRGGPWKIHIEASASGVSRDVGVEVSETKEGASAWILVDIPATRLRVRVVDADGKPAAKSCIVSLESVLTHETQQMFTSTGELESAGLEPGEWIVQAESLRAFSDRKAVTVEEQGRQEVTLTLSDLRVVEGVVVSSLGMPVPYARLQPVRHDSRLDLFPAPVTSDALGRFQLRIPAGVARVGVLVQAPGHAVTSTVLSATGTETVVVQVPFEGGRITFSFDSTAWPPPRMPWVSDGTLTFPGLLLTGSPETRVSYRGGRTFVEVRSYRPGAFGVCPAVLGGASDLDLVGRGCLFGETTLRKDLVLDLGDPGGAAVPR